ncbi:hypothetical protein [Devosia ginsengisoli]|uniref:hypothetical protein n=1 Tax=Devosia ginsengisoli TaxID=400770 RepID=UPI0026EDAA3B|nr:hypothetical protein [Devosia ginsengisoli]MCR6673276.1 hypothetical protein [Devosia ginsengisoli]
MIHYHGTPITPISALLDLRGAHFCVSHARPDDVKRVHMIGQSVMLDNGAFSKWKRGRETNWTAYYDWADRWLDFPTTWAVIPDEIGAGWQLQDALIGEWPHGVRGAPVWHMDEPIDRLLKLADEWPRVCVGSTDEFSIVLSPAWRRRQDELWNAIAARHRRLPWLHMLRGMQLSGGPYPYASVDSTDIAQNHNRPQNSPSKMRSRWDAQQTPGRWNSQPEQMELSN